MQITPRVFSLFLLRPAQLRSVRKNSKIIRAKVNEAAAIFCYRSGG
jgi:hypothetical protein